MHDLNEIYVKECTGGCNKNKRSQNTENDICLEVNSKWDGLPVRCVGSWAQKKIYYLLQYFGIFSASMHKKWSKNINYIEICSGIGRCIARDTKMEFDGTALGIIKHKEFEHLGKAIFIDLDDQTIDILTKRFANQNIKNGFALKSDYTDIDGLIDVLKKYIDIKTGLNLFLIDPTDCSVPFKLIDQIKKTFPNSDFIINIAIGTDFTRNVIGAVESPDSYKKVKKKYSVFLGSDEFFNDPNTIKFASINDLTSLRTLFREYYVKSLANSGLIHTDFIRVRNYYDLVFASQHPLGLKFWKEASKYEQDGQKTLNF